MIVIKPAHIRKLAALILMLHLVPLSWAQDEVDPSEVTEKRSGRMWQLGQEAIRTGNHYLALHYFEQIYTRDSSDLDVVIALADLYRTTHNYTKAEKFYTKIIKSKKGNKHPEALFYLAQAQKNNEKYADAKANLLKFKKLVKKVKDPRLKKLYKSELDGCEMMLAKTKDSSTVVVRNLGKEVNHPHIDFSPIPLGETKLIYGSYPENKEKIYKLNENGEAKTEKRVFMTAEKTGSSWKGNGEFEELFNDTTMDVANGCFSLDSSRFYFSKCAINWQYKTICTIYESHRTKNGWSKPKPLNELINLPEFTASHPTVGRESKRNQEVLYFVSDRDGTRGGMDIWFAEYDPRKKTFKKPRNAGSKINTAGNEMTPFYDLASKTLYFSSDGKPNMGGLDVFSAIGEGSNWQESVNLGSGINSSADDLDYVLRPSNRGGYFVSNRPGGLSLYHATCCDDIYEFEFSKFIDIDALIRIKDLNDQELKEDVVVNLYLVSNNEKFLVSSDTSQIRQLRLRSDQDYVVEVKKPGYYNATTSMSTKGIIEDTHLKKEVKLEKMPEDPIILPNINFEFDSPKLTPDSKLAIDTTLLELFKRQPNIKIEISAHSDSKGSDAYNLSLSQKRAESIVKYLNSKGVPLEQMIPKGYGETKPIAPNANPDGTDNPEGRRKNRRVEFKILGEIQPIYNDSE